MDHFMNCLQKLIWLWSNESTVLVSHNFTIGLTHKQCTGQTNILPSAPSSLSKLFMLFIISQFRYLLIILFSVFDEIGMWNDWYWDWISRTWIVQNRHQCSCYWHHHHRWFCGRQVAMSMIYENKQTKKLVTIISIRSNEWQWLILRQRQTKNENNGVWRNRVFHISMWNSTTNILNSHYINSNLLLW